MAKEFLTNERLKGLFKSNFDLANYAMRVARHDISAGKEFTIEGTLGEIIKNPKVLQERQELDAIEEDDNLEQDSF